MLEFIREGGMFLAQRIRTSEAGKRFFLSHNPCNLTQSVTRGIGLTHMVVK